jgi:general secretion pathway protein G
MTSKGVRRTMMSTTKKAVAIGGSIVVVAIALIIAAAARRPMHGKWYQHWRAKLDIEMFADVLDQYRTEHGRYPTTDEGLGPLVANRFLRKIPLDPWHNQYHYVCPGKHNPGGFDLWSDGADGCQGGSDLNKDVTNWPGA